MAHFCEAVNVAATRGADSAIAQRLGNKAFCVYYNIEMLKFCLRFRLFQKIFNIFYRFFRLDLNNT